MKPFKIGKYVKIKILIWQVEEGMLGEMVKKG